MPMIQELGLVLLIVTGFGLLLKKAKLPLIVGYMLTGILAGPILLDTLHDNQILSLFSTLGISTLLFSIGLHLSPKAIKDLGKQALMLGLIQVASTTVIGTGLLMLLGFSLYPSLFVGIALSFSSTIVVLKLLSDRNEIHQLHGKLAIGLLLIQDLIVSLVLIGLAAIQNTTDASLALSLLLLMGKAFAAVTGLILIYKLILTKVLSFIAKESELLFISSLAWGLGVALLFDYLGLSLEIGALIAGVILASSVYAEEMASRLRPLRDFFLLIFFVELGANLNPGAASEYVLPILALSIFVIIWKPIIIMLILRGLGFHKKIGFKTGLSMAQISEFSLIMVAIGLKSGLLGDEYVQILGLVGLFTITVSTILISRLNTLYLTAKDYLDLFIPSSNGANTNTKQKHPDVLVFGYNRVGREFIAGIKKQNLNVGVVDFNPEVVAQLKAEAIPHHFGDAGDVEFLSDLPLHKIKLVISAVPDLESNLILISHLQERAGRVASIIFSHNQDDAQTLYDRGASLVVIPHRLAANRIVYWLSRYGIDQQVLMNKR